MKIYFSLLLLSVLLISCKNNPTDSSNTPKAILIFERNEIDSIAYGDVYETKKFWGNYNLDADSIMLSFIVNTNLNDTGFYNNISFNFDDTAHGNTIGWYALPPHQKWISGTNSYSVMYKIPSYMRKTYLRFEYRLICKKQNTFISVHNFKIYKK